MDRGNGGPREWQTLGMADRNLRFRVRVKDRVRVRLRVRVRG